MNRLADCGYFNCKSISTRLYRTLCEISQSPDNIAALKYTRMYVYEVRVRSRLSTELMCSLLRER